MFSVTYSTGEMMIYSFFIVAFLVSSGSSQGVINGDPYFCVPSGICPTVNGGGIDPRILTPDGGGPGPTSGPSGNGVCPNGRYVCYAQGSSSNCGQRRVPTNNADGYAEIEAYPWQAFMTGSSGTYIGSGSLLSPYHVLTAAHKVLAYVNNAAQLTIIMGVTDPQNINPSSPRSSAAEITIYNLTPYNNNTLKNDIAIVRLANPISLLDRTSVNTICLPNSNTNANTYSNRQRCVVAGWGQTQVTNTIIPTRLKQVMVTTTDINTCESGFNRRVDTSIYLDKTGGQICAGGEPQKDACFQDGGAPLVCGDGTTSSRYNTVAGIVIWGKSCGQPGVYGVYTNVPAYRQWIVDIITRQIP